MKRSDVEYPQVVCEECFAIVDASDRQLQSREQTNREGTLRVHQHLHFFTSEVKWYCNHHCCNHSGCVPLSHPKAADHRREDERRRLEREQ